jgi:ATP-binding cassette subfamily D (ALD) protein 3
VLNRLWPLKKGAITKPRSSDIMFIPQRPYFPIGTFRDQVIYPDTLEDMKSKGSFSLSPLSLSLFLSLSLSLLFC